MNNFTIYEIVDFLNAAFEAEHGVDLQLDTLARVRVEEAAIKAQAEIRDIDPVEVSIPFVCATAAGPQHLYVTLHSEALFARRKDRAAAHKAKDRRLPRPKGK